MNDNKKIKTKKNGGAKEEKSEKVASNEKDNQPGEWEDKYKRALADYQNLLRRTAKEKEEFAKFANERLLLEMLPIYDNLKTAIKHGDEKNHSQWLAGVKYIVKQFKDVLANLGIEEIKTMDEKFDPNLMEAIKGEGPKVKKEIKSGYKLNGKVIVPAKVILE